MRLAFDRHAHVRRSLSLLLVGALGGCAIIDDEDGDGPGGGKADDPGGECTDPGYGDGTCQTDLACAAPDIDCFLIFQEQTAAEQWFMKFETAVAAEQFRGPRAIIPSSDPRWQHMRQLLDRGWDAYQDVNPVGDLASASPALIVIEDPTVNAFVVPDLDTGKAGFAVVVQTGLLDKGGEDAPLLGLVMHELQHAVGLHIVADVKQRIRRFYAAGAYEEPLGFEQVDDATVREAVDAWRRVADEVGPFADEELGGMPVGESQLARIFKTALLPHVESHAEACAGPMADLEALQADLVPQLDMLDMTWDVDAELRGRIDAGLGRLREECMADFTQSFADVVAGIAGTTPQAILDGMTAEDRALAEGVHFIAAIEALGIDRRAKLRAVEQAYATATGQPWDRVRYFSTEEAADDATVPVLDAMDMQPDALGVFLVNVLDDATIPRCRSLLDDGATPPYGADLSDEHHATCWRIAHVAQLADSGKVTGESSTPGQSYRRPRVPLVLPDHRPLPLPPRLSDLILY